MKILLIAVVMALSSCAYYGTPPTTVNVYKDMIAKVQPALVRITSTNPEGVLLDDLSSRLGIEIPKSLKSLAKKTSGSGFIVDPHGVVVTNEHVLHPEWLTVVTLADGRKFMAEGMAMYEKIDIGIIQLRAVIEPLPYVEFARHDVERGDTIWMVGRNKYFDLSFKTGVVSYEYRRNMDGTLDLQTTIHVIPGESGSAVFDMEGHVVGVVQGYFPSLQGVSSCVPRIVVESAVHDLMSALRRELR